MPNLPISCLFHRSRFSASLSASLLSSTRLLSLTQPQSVIHRRISTSHLQQPSITPHHLYRPRGVVYPRLDRSFRVPSSCMQRSKRSFASSPSSDQQTTATAATAELGPYQFRTISGPQTDILLKEKGSKFIGYAYPIASDEEFKIALQLVKNEHPRSTHHCFAYRMGINGANSRAYDDGEPSSSAGIPILNQLIAKDVTNVLLVVVRYFGGTKLGVSGLIKAYKESAQETLDACDFIVTELTVPLSVSFNDFTHQNSIYNVLAKHDSHVLDIAFDEDDDTRGIISTCVKLSQKDVVVAALQNISHNITVSVDDSSG